MKLGNIILLGLTMLMAASCASFRRVTRHDFDSGFYKLKTQGSDPSHVYVNVIDDSMVVYPVRNVRNKNIPDTSSFTGIRISKINPGNYFYKSCFISNSFDADLTSILFKYRHPRDDVPGQFSADLNFAIYMGFRRDFYKLVSPSYPLKEEKTFIRQIGFNLGVFAGIGTSPVNPTVTNNIISQEYDAMIFQKGVAGFLSFGKMSLGLAVGFDNILDKSKSSWIYNQKPNLGLIITVSNF
jgi:hypothetical protein